MHPPLFKKPVLESTSHDVAFVIPEGEYEGLFVDEVPSRALQELIRTCKNETVKQYLLEEYNWRDNNDKHF